MKKLIVSLVALAAVIGAVLIVFPNIEIRPTATLYVCQYSDSFGEFEENPSYNERYFYNEKRDISIDKMEVRSVLFCHVLELKFVEGDKRETQFVLEEDYIKNFIEKYMNE